MRIESLELVRYGKFTGEKLALPRAECDFHFIVGPNEAGKSTIRSAIGDLLFGIPMRSRQGFRHPLSDLRLGATLEHERGLLVFQRVKANKNTLRDVNDVAFADSTLVDILGTGDRSFFEQMFALDHQSLVSGGQAIVDSSSDLGRLLFESASGIDSLGAVCKKLEAEADEIWTNRKSNSRKYYIAADRYEDARKQVANASVRTKVWSDAYEACEEADRKLEEESSRHRNLEVRRAQLERIRRVAPDLAALKEREAVLAELGEVLDLPEDAATRLSVAQQELARAEPALELRLRQQTEQEAALKAIRLDTPILDATREIERLDEMRNRFGDHETDLILRQHEVEQALELAASEARQLAWAGDEVSLRAALPGAPALAPIPKLITNKAVLGSGVLNAERAVSRKRDELERLRKDLAAAGSVSLSPGLAQALAEAKFSRSSDVRVASLRSSVTSAEEQLQTCLQALGKWRMDIGTLRAMALPSEEFLTQRRSHQQNFIAEVRQCREANREAKARVESTQLAIAQFQQGRHLVTAADVSQARSKRDNVWSAIKTNALAMQDGAQQLDDGIRMADELVDSQLSSISESTELLNLRHTLEREQGELARLAALSEERQAALDAFDQAWSTYCEELGLSGMALDEIAGWMSRRTEALRAGNDLQEKTETLAEQEESRKRAFESLSYEVLASGLTIAEDFSAAQLIAVGTDRVSASADAEAQRMAIQRQLADGDIELAELERNAKEANDALKEWQSRWEITLESVKLHRFKDNVDAVEAAVKAIGEIRDALDKADEIRAQRIETMRADLKHFGEAAQALVSDLDPALSGAAPQLVAKALLGRLQSARVASTEAARLEGEIRRSRKAVNEAQEDLAAARKSLLPLMQAGGVEQVLALVPLVERSQRKRELQRSIEEARAKVLGNGDGLSLADIEREVSGNDVDLVMTELERVKADAQASIDTQRRMQEVCLVARQALQAIAGSANAALAEGRRHEALAEMADASERYVNVATAGKLLRWAIDRYRERKQGPMLTRAGEVFRGLTLGGFIRLSVDYDAQPLVLTAVRDTGEVVEIEGMSEGTRDQLFMALRLAALELHLGQDQARALPFVADDLLVNFSDDRVRAGLEALKDLSRRTQVVFLSHHDHLLEMVRDVFGAGVNVVQVGRTLDHAVEIAA